MRVFCAVLVLPARALSSAALNPPSTQIPPNVPLPVLSETFWFVAMLKRKKALVLASPTQNVVAGLLGSNVNACKLLFEPNLIFVTPPDEVTSLTSLWPATSTPAVPSPGGRILIA